MGISASDTQKLPKGRAAEVKRRGAPVLTLRCLEESVQSLWGHGRWRGDKLYYRHDHRPFVASQVLYEVCAPGQCVVALRSRLSTFLDTLGSLEGALAAAHAVEELLWALVDQLVKQSLAVATHAFEDEQFTQLWVLDLEAGDPHTEGHFVGGVLRIDAVPLADPDVGPGVARLVFHDLVDAEEATFQDRLDGLVSRLSGVVGLGVEEGLGPGPVCREELAEVFVYGASAFGVSKGPHLDVISLVFWLGARGRHTGNEAHGGATQMRDGNRFGHLCEGSLRTGQTFLCRHSHCTLKAVRGPTPPDGFRRSGEAYTSYPVTLGDESYATVDRRSVFAENQDDATTSAQVLVFAKAHKQQVEHFQHLGKAHKGDAMSLIKWRRADMGTRVRERRGARKGSKSDGDDRNSDFGRWACAAFPNFKGAVFGKAVASDLPKEAFVLEDETFDADLGEKKGADALVGSNTRQQQSVKESKGGSGRI